MTFNPKSPSKFVGLTPGFQSQNGDSWNLGLTPSIFGGFGASSGGSKGMGGTGITPLLNGFAKEINPFEFTFAGVEPDSNEGIDSAHGEKRGLETPGEVIDPKRFKPSAPTSSGTNSLPIPKPKRADTDSGSSAISSVEGRSFFSSGNLSSGLETSNSEGPSKYTSSIQINEITNSHLKEDSGSAGGAQAIISGLAINPQQLINGVQDITASQLRKVQQQPQPQQYHVRPSIESADGFHFQAPPTSSAAMKNGSTYSQSTLYIPPFQGNARNTRSNVGVAKSPSEIILSDEDEDEDDEYTQPVLKNKGKKKENVSPTTKSKGAAVNGNGLKGKGKESKSKVLKIEDTEEDKRKQFLERNRIAACKSRQKKKEWIQNLGVRESAFNVSLCSV
jgi:hypothetical protein